MQQHTNFTLSLYLDSHPVLMENDDYRKCYLEALGYIVVHYRIKNNIFNKLFENYVVKFGFTLRNIQTQFNSSERKRVFRKALRAKFNLKEIRIYSYRYCFLMDLFFILSFTDSKKAYQIYSHLQDKYKFYRNKKYSTFIDLLYGRIKTAKNIPINQNMMACWNKNREFIRREKKTIMITANMSAGKSTLINALFGRKIAKTQNQACTDRLYYFSSKPYEDGYIYLRNDTFNLNANESALLDLESMGDCKEVGISAFFRSIWSVKHRFTMVDTPGANYTINAGHGDITREQIKNKNYHLLVYMANACTMGTDDEYDAISFIYNNVKNRRIIFIINKLDDFERGCDSVEDTIADFRKDLTKIGFKNPLICPIASYTGYLAKKKLWNDQLTKYESIEYERHLSIFSESSKDLSQYYTGDVTAEIKQYNSEPLELMKRSGILNLEYILFRGEWYND